MALPLRSAWFLGSLLSSLKWLSGLALVALLVGCGQGASIGGPGSASAAPAAARPGAVTVEVLYMNHPPLRPTLTEVDKVLASYGDRVKVSRYDVDTPQGEAFATAHNLTGHVPLAIFVNGSMDFKVAGRQGKFYSFPQGQGNFMAPDGAWTVKDLDAVLAQATGGKP